VTDAAFIVVDETTIGVATAELGGRDPDLAAVVTTFGLPPLWSREPSFETLALIILEQQVSLGAARAAYGRLVGAVGAVGPGRILVAGESRLRSAGITRQKSRYLVELATAVTSGRLEIDRLRDLNDDHVRETLTRVPGIGRWTADVYLLFALGRPDIWPSGDLALATAAQEVKHLAERPTPLELERMATAWQPWRGVAARLLWHAYLSARDRAG
jgi:DNA-3-methyladenine glycosylase II